jgi:NAD-dependent dihydropyrimidine dehydrogenase PreA subunit
MNPFKFIWGMFFRLFPCPTQVGLVPIGNPGRDSPVLVTCNFYITVRRMIRRLRGLDLWLLVADSKGVNVWCAAGAEEFNTHSVVAAVKTSGIADRVDHRRLTLPPLGAPGIRAKDVEEQTGWSVRWGPVRERDIPRYLGEGERRDEGMKRATYDWQERLDTGLGSLFPFFFLGAIGFAIFGRNLLLDYIVVGGLACVFFMLACPFLPGKTGLAKVIFLEIGLGCLLFVTEVWDIPRSFSLRADLIIAMVMFLIYGTELGGLASTLPSDLDPFLARLGIGALGNVEFAGTIRTELLNGFRVLTYYPENCVACRGCVEVCPQGVWAFGEDKRAVCACKDACTACRACIVQCKGDAIRAEPMTGEHTRST